MNEKLEHLKKSGAVFLPPSNAHVLELANMAFQQMKASIMAKELTDFYLSYGGAILGDACVFPADDINREESHYILPSIIKANRDLSHFPVIRGKTIWGQNQFYLFSCDGVGGMYMHDVLTLQILRKYSDFWTAMSDCLLVGKV